ncbi:hypothetical protein CONCODRAFT_3809 [Conidiobolus coronatus NRRL 28638]|uniref:Uncharacterized protein n=1 Tax=Conidiobolus coronatus (strain ATCC 28846 / CBS 209.66 / NRRL 28638) TaxID=796925 RepID=A0A137PDS4_CONC2|nr:hypothetical protein CONCODRAFT_3809 [Conidiobolus coronatus NRRL 28638]|eukprot:KXN73147.1 hypothetical protein CONCODRAFT_3809 [Conidiobolus coronatus NRRL 28638]
MKVSAWWVKVQQLMDNINELLQAIRTIKFFAWVDQFKAKFRKSRGVELKDILTEDTPKLKETKEYSRSTANLEEWLTPANALGIQKCQKLRQSRPVPQIL